MTATELLQNLEFTSRVTQLLSEHHVPGLAIAIVEKGEVTSRGFGHASLNPPIPFEADTLMDIASASKSITAASIALMVEDDENYPDVHWESIVSDLLPGDFVMPEESYTESVTVEDILSHRTGMPSHDSSYLGPNAACPDGPLTVTQNLRNLPVAAPIRTKYMYCNMMYTVAAYLIEQESGMSFSDYVHKRLFAPLGMTSSSIQPSQAISKGFGDRIAMGHAWDTDRQKYIAFPGPDCPEGVGAGSIVTSVNDYIKYVAAFMNHKPPFSEAIVNGVIRGRSFPNPDEEKLPPLTSPITYAAGWELSWYRGHKIVMHDGSISGFGTSHFFLPGIKFGGAIFGNSEGASTLVAVLVRELIDEALAVPSEERPDWDKFFTENDGDAADPDAEAKVREELCPGMKKPQPHTPPLTAYLGTFYNPGYHDLVVQIKDGRLFIDATDRSFPFTISLQHVCEQTKFVACLKDTIVESKEYLRAIFQVTDGRATRLRIDFEPDLKDTDGFIWFHRV